MLFGKKTFPLEGLNFGVCALACVIEGRVFFAVECGSHPWTEY